MSDFRKPRTDNPIVPQSALFRKVKKAPKKPKGRRGRKPKGKKSGNFVSRQDPNFILRKEEEELRRAREDRQRQSQTQESLVQLQIEDIRDRREDRAGQLQIEQDRFALDAAEGRANRRIQREQLRLQGEENQRTDRYRAAKLAQGANQGAARAAEAVRARQDSMDIYAQLRQQHRSQERRDGENREVMRNLLEGARDRRPEDIDPRQFFESDLSVEGERARETTALTFGPFAPRATPEQRRQRRKKVSNKESDDISSSVEEVFSRAGRKQTPAEISGKGKFLRGKTTAPDRLGEFATQSEIDRGLATPRPEPEPEPAPTDSAEELVFEGEKLLRQAYHTDETGVYRPQVKTYKQVRKDNPVKDYRG
tara:strand:- start:1206 stop:2306 length:1101 start_codon:yes stop_codon:yes gene_type:complete